MPSLSSLKLWSPCSCSDIPLSRLGAVLTHFDSPTSCCRLTAHFFPFGKGSSGELANWFLCGTEATLSFSAGPVCSSFSAQVCAILQAYCWSWQHQQVCYFSYLTLALSSPPYPLLHLFFYLKLSGRSGRNCLLSPVQSGYNGSQGTCFSWRMTQLMSWPNR